MNERTNTVQTPIAPKCLFLDGFTLKVIAVITMFIDHAAMALMTDSYGTTTSYSTLRAIGRIAMPIYCFMIVQGLLHTHNVKKYMLRLFICAVASEIPFNLALNAGYGQNVNNLMFYKSAFFLEASYKMGDFTVVLRPSDQNVLWTLLFGLICIDIFERLRVSGKKIRFLVDPLLMIGMCILADYLQTDYGWLGIALVVLFYLCRNMRIGDLAIAPAVAVVMFNLAYFLFYFIFTNTVQTGEMYSLLAIVPLMFYNGKRGFSNNFIKYGFYAFYPVHLTLLFFVKLIINL